MSDGMSEERMDKYKIDVDLAKGKGSYRLRWLKELNKKLEEATAAREPFCFRCAKIDFEEKQTALFRKDLRGWKAKGINFEDDVPVELDLRPYADKKRFLKVSEKPVVEEKLLDGMKAEVRTGTYFRYQCKERGEHISVLMPYSEPVKDAKPAKA